MNLFTAFHNMVTDPAWITELLLLSLTWVIFSLRKFSLKSVLLHTLGLAMALMLCNMGLFFLSSRQRSLFPVLWSLVLSVVSLAFVWHFAPFRPKSKLLLWIAIYNVVLSTSGLSGQCSLLVSTVTDSSLVIGTARASIYLLMPLSALFIRKKNFDDYLVVPDSCLFLVGILLAGEAALSIAEAFFFNASNAITAIFAIAYGCILAVDLVAVQTLHTICSEQQEVYNLTAEKQRYLTEREISEIAACSLEDLRCIRHDLKNHYSYLQILLEQQRYDELKEYLQSMQDNLPPQLTLIDCGNQVVNTVLNMEFSKLRTRGIALEHQLVVPPVLPFRDEDMCSLLANLLDNAREECTRLQDKGRTDMLVRLEIYPRHSYLLLRCLNSTDRTELPRRGIGLITTKSEQAYHGFGTRIIVKLAEKYNGCADFQLEDGTFVAQVMLDMTGGDKK